MTNLLDSYSLLSKDKQTVFIEFSQWVGGPRRIHSVGGQAFNKGYWYFSIDNKQTWTFTNITTKDILVNKISKSTIEELKKYFKL